jgi:hypothetical protein
MYTREYRVCLVNGKYGYGDTAWKALLDACKNERKADLIAAHIKHISSITGIIYALNGVEIGKQERTI